MASTSNKLYQDPGFDARRLVDTYLSNKSVEVFGDELLKIPMEKVHNSLSSGRVRGTTLMDISLSSYIHYLYPTCEIFKEITLMRFGDACVMELKKWLYDHTGAYDWSHTAAIIKELEGDRGHREWKDIKLKKANHTGHKM
ncbi:indolethylamine N-methyltransferase-like isoform X2 [Dendropsophus ebraccatus]|uniref:indolethylamine N-methyltransferase-like isoform X2 n=1 Tax=Dendropsophus ebraccatus TaxID=150705 RepID=UPI0038317CC2